MIERKSWKEFRDSKLLWWINRQLHLFGWVLVAEVNNKGLITDIYPARTKFRGFREEDETEGFKKLTEYIEKEIPNLLEDIKENI